MKKENNIKKKISITNIGNIAKINFICLIIILFPFIFSFPINIFNNYNSEITLKLQGIGQQKIINCRNTNPPDYVYLNNENIDIFTNDNYRTINIKEEKKEENIIKLVWKNSINSLYATFEKISNITEVDLSKINTQVNNLADLFRECTSLKKVNLSNLDTSKVDNMGHMFAYCKSLESIDLSGFNTSNVLYLDNMFLNCISLTSLNLEYFYINKAVKTEYMFKNCNSLTSLNLCNFYISGNDNISNMFMDCKKLEYLNIKNFKILEHPKHLVIQNIIRNTTRNIVICINTQGQPEVYEHLEK